MNNLRWEILQRAECRKKTKYTFFESEKYLWNKHEDLPEQRGWNK